jgi:hypothetical protein
MERSELAPAFLTDNRYKEETIHRKGLEAQDDWIGLQIRVYDEVASQMRAEDIPEGKRKQIAHNALVHVFKTYESFEKAYSKATDPHFAQFKEEWEKTLETVGKAPMADLAVDLAKLNVSRIKYDFM